MTDLGAIYSSEDYLTHNPTWGEERAAWKAAQIHRMLRREGIWPRSICDVGCGTAGVLRNLVPMLDTAEEVVGYEPSPVAAEMARTACDGTSVEVVQATVDQIDRHFDVALCLDVFEHVDDYIGFIRQLRPVADVVVFHIPLDISVQAVARGTAFGRMREMVGHLHYFTADTALATLEHCGFRIVANDYTASSIEGPGRSRRQQVAGCLRRTAVAALGRRLGVRLVGGFALVVLARPEQ